MKGLGFDVDNNNKPSKEKILDYEENDKEIEDQPATWEWDGICQTKGQDHYNNNPNLKGVSEFIISTMSYAV